MNSQLLSVGKKFLALIVMSLATLGLAACAMEAIDRSDSMRDEVSGESAVKELSVEAGEVSYKEDQKSIQELRKDIPEPVKTDNELLGETLKMMGGEVKQKPTKIRSRFRKQMRKVRNKFTKSHRKKREKIRKEERKKREKFMKALKDEREDFNDNDKVTREERKEFYSEQDAKRREYFANERDKRKEFESDMREKSNDFNSMVRERNREFDREYRIYSKKYKEMEKLKKEGKSTTRYQNIENRYVPDKQPRKQYEPLTTDQ